MAEAAAFLYTTGPGLDTMRRFSSHGAHARVQQHLAGQFKPAPPSRLA
jgi:hypothetical protein